MDTEKFFIYGSLSLGMVHFDKIKDFIVSAQPARITGQAYRLPVGFPVIAEDDAQEIQGHLVELKASDLLLQLLDEFHGVVPGQPEKSLHRRIQREVDCGGARVQVSVYMINPAKLPKGAQKIPNGDWLEQMKSQPPMTEKLTERQRDYLLRLNQSKGRDIVPIDLNLYRELLGLELIVDKGRRLALSKLGKEVCHYLS